MQIRTATQKEEYSILNTKNSFFDQKNITVEHKPISGTSGYDIHYAIPAGEEKRASELKQEVLSYIAEYTESQSGAPVHVTMQRQLEEPFGPWQTSMWEIQLCTVDETTSLDDLSAIESDKIAELYLFMRSVAQFTQARIAELDLKGSLLIHANIWPADSNMELERAMHYDKAWLVCGKKIVFKDVWQTLITMEKTLKELIAEKGDNWRDSLDDIRSTFKEKFADNDSYPPGPELDRATNFLISGQENLKKMNDEIAKRDLKRLSRS